MKIHKKRVSRTVTTYECEFCGKEYQSKSSSVKCEKMHGCDHSDITYEFEDASDESWWFNVKGISATCTSCGKEMGDVSFEDIDDNQNLLLSIYNLIKEV